MEPNTKQALHGNECAQKFNTQPDEVVAKFLLDSMQHPDRRLMQAAFATTGLEVDAPVAGAIGSASKVADATTLKMSGYHERDYDLERHNYDRSYCDSPNRFREDPSDNEGLGTFYAKNTERFFPEIDSKN